MDWANLLVSLVVIAMPICFVLLCVVAVRRSRERTREHERKAREPFLCLTCEAEAPPNRKKRGNAFVEFCLWWCALLPGLLYHLWRASDKAPKCSVCGAKNLVPLNSPAAKKRRQRADSELAVAQ